MRLFVAVSPGAEVIRRITGKVDVLRAMAPSAKWVKADSLHLTLAFLGERDAADAPRLAAAVSEAAAKHASFELVFRGGGVFGRQNRPRVLWAGCEGDVGALAALARDVEAALLPCGYVPDARGFNAHLTLARSREQGGDFALAHCVEALTRSDFGAARIEEVTLYESRLSSAGAHYEAVHRARLSGAMAGDAKGDAPA